MVCDSDKASNERRGSDSEEELPHHAARQETEQAGDHYAAEKQAGHFLAVICNVTLARGRDGQLRDVFFHCSATVAGQSLHPEAYPGIQANFRALFPKVAAMKADIFLANHDSFFGLHAKRQRLEAGDANAFVDPGELARFNAAMEQAFGAELARQKSPQGSDK